MVFTLDFWPAFLLGLGAILAYLVALWAFSLTVKDSGIIEYTWPLGVSFAGWLYFLLVSDVITSARGWLIMGLVMAWSLRQMWAAFVRLLPYGDDEAPRYAALRDQHGKRWWWLSLVRVFLPYAPLIWVASVVMLPVHLYRSGPTTLWLDWVGAALWLMGFALVLITDWGRSDDQPERDRGPLLPLGGALCWWGVYLIAASTPNGWLTFASPIVMTLYLGRAYLPFPARRST